MKDKWLEESEAAQRQQELYDFLTIRGERWTPMRNVTGTIGLYPGHRRGDYHNSSARRLLTRDIEQINNNSKFEKVIISGNKGIKLANEREFEKFIMAEYREIFKKLKQIRTIGKKVLRDQQMDFEGKVYEAFMN